ncbi:hypothetical protein FRAAL2274 [Frankia alni ACN14a]|uniref:Uncharacterized protein n=1 Tax=Frankia alni (strain DSM 45986 / CECT 9034 / ACN14a) TaxID=326424 RepID=Q0RNG5_FRAAA|nr:hypothetical protein FRAAL2274 [Frankia alni ACN14a]
MDASADERAPALTLAGEVVTAVRARTCGPAPREAGARASRASRAGPGSRRSMATCRPARSRAGGGCRCGLVASGRDDPDVAVEVTRPGWASGMAGPGDRPPGPTRIDPEDGAGMAAKCVRR